MDVGVTLESGQFFRWRREKDGFVVATHGRAFRVPPLSPAARKFFALDHDIDAICGTLRRDRKLRPALRTDLRLLRQDPWECLVSFLTSCASNIPRITKNLDALCRTLGRPLAHGLHAMPPPEAVDDEKLLRRLGFGFRAKYLVPVAREVSRGALRGMERMSTDEARLRLCELPGVAEKVADCVLLFAYERLEAFPLDVWIRRVMRELYLRGNDREIRAFAADRWNGLAGYAQQFLYVWSRNR